MWALIRPAMPSSDFKTFLILFQRNYREHPNNFWYRIFNCKTRLVLIETSLFITEFSIILGAQVTLLLAMLKNTKTVKKKLSKKLHHVTWNKFRHCCQNPEVFWQDVYTWDTLEDTCNNLINKEAFTVFYLMVQCYELQPYKNVQQMISH